ncbi:LysR family transcriptional regulator [Microbulbifer thermotolerans]|uniref:LysR family transcriptional regulator n=1 Tax=Microbulbifer thermotolerans TaxID=252514 RepID=UPI0026722DDF|nr:LysR family transcriptional regulator [Microbulbifer thermotolerans]WKT60208.1 LysR family transcriptional regulator [Microbulbifer thermotolerans]
MDLRRLRTFVRVAKLRSFSKAASELNTVQPAISRQIAALEEELGTPLLWRNTRQVQVTPAGEALLEQASVMLALESGIKRRVLSAAQGETGELRIGYISSACADFLPGLMRRYREHYPDVHIVLTDMTAQQQREAFQVGRIDVGMSRPLLVAGELGLTAELVYEDALLAVLPESHPLAKQSRLNLSHLAEEPFILFQRGEAIGLFDQILSACHQAGFSPRVISEPASMQTLLTSVGCGLGVSVVPGCIRGLNTVGCIFRPLKDLLAPVRLELHYDKQRLKPTVAGFVEEVHNTLPEIRARMGTDGNWGD